MNDMGCHVVMKITTHDGEILNVGQQQYDQYDGKQCCEAVRIKAEDIKTII
jgi:hypothetical protein